MLHGSQRQRFGSGDEEDLSARYEAEQVVLATTTEVRDTVFQHIPDAQEFRHILDVLPTHGLAEH